MDLNQRINSFAQLGTFLKQFSPNRIQKTDDTELNNLFFDVFKMQIERAEESNGWFTRDNVLKAFESWANALTKENLSKWTSVYSFNNTKPKTIAIIMAGNIPLVGFHDLLCVLITGNIAKIKLSSNDKHFLPLIFKFLAYHNPYFKNKVEFTEEKLENFDAVIATGSNNTARYFDYYFGKYPSIIRKNRNSVAILTGKESENELELLGNDIFQYFGLGCRSVSKIFVPKGYNFDKLFKAIYKFKNIINYKKYENNYNYNKTVYLMSEFNLLENGFVMLKEDSSYSSPIATLFYEFYDSEKLLSKKLKNDKEYIQCAVGSHKDFINFGETQNPKLWDYADGVDSIAFLNNL
jgi:hypothetical protein